MNSNIDIKQTNHAQELVYIRLVKLVNSNSTWFIMDKGSDRKTLCRFRYDVSRDPCSLERDDLDDLRRKSQICELFKIFKTQKFLHIL